MSEGRLNTFGYVAGAIGALLVFDDSGWLVLLGVVLMVAGFFFVLASDPYGDPSPYIVAAAVVFALVIFSGANTNSYRDSEEGDSMACGIGRC